MDPKVAIFIAVCVLIISFVWRPGMLVKYEYYPTHSAAHGHRHNTTSGQGHGHRKTEHYVQPEQQDLATDNVPIEGGGGDELEQYNDCYASWWNAKCNISDELDFMPSDPIERPRDFNADLAPEYAPMSPDGTRRVLGPDGEKAVLPLTNAWDNSNEVMGGLASLDQTQLDQIQGSAVQGLQM